MSLDARAQALWQQLAQSGVVAGDAPDIDDDTPWYLAALIGVSAWILGSRRRDRAVWMGGAVLMGIVLLKLLAVDRSYMGNLPGIVSFMAVGLLLVGVGWIAPSPPRTASSEANAWRRRST